MTTTVAAPSMLLTEARVVDAVRLSPAFVRVTLASPALADVGRPGYDARCKMIFPGPDGQLAPLPEDPEQWYVEWLARPEHERSPIRTYTVRDVLGEGPETRVVIDMVVHEADAAHSGGPACAWALAARPGDRVQLVLPYQPIVERVKPHGQSLGNTADSDYEPGTV